MRGLHVADRIALSLTVPAEHVADVEAHRDFVADETLAVELTVTAGAALDVAVAKRQV